MRYNWLFSRRVQTSGPLAYWQQASFSGEAVRLLSLDLEATHFEPSSSTAPNARPTLFFRGRSEGGAPHESTLRGSVTMLDSGCIRWRMTSSYGGQQRWASEGVQLAIQSQSGVLGAWGGVERDDEGPLSAHRRSR